MELQRPSEAHEKLFRLAGQWRGEERFHPSRWDPQGSTAVIRMNAHPRLDGFVLATDYEQEKRGVVVFRGVAIYQYSKKSHQYMMVWFDSIGSDPEIYHGTFEGDLLRLQSESPNSHHRLSYRFVGENGLTSHMEWSPDGESWKTLFEGRYERVG